MNSFYFGILAFLFGVLCSFMFSWKGLIFAFCFLYFLNKKFFGLFLLILVCFFAGIFRWEISKIVINTSDVAYYNDFNENEVFVGVIAGEPDLRRDSQRIVVRLCKEDALEVCGKTLVFLERYPEFFYGDYLKFQGKLKEPFETSEFSYKTYLSRFSIDSVMYYPKVEFIEFGRGNAMLSRIYQFKKMLEDRLNLIFTEPTASLAAGLLLGSRRGMNDDLKIKFDNAGLTHIIAVSGYNIAIVIAFVSGFFGFVERRKRFVLEVMFIFIFVVLVGMSAAALRAALMGIIALLALQCGRKSSALNALILSAFLMILWNPKILFFDVGFQLSFSATLGLILLSSYLDRFLKFVPEYLAVRSSLVMTLSAQIATLPILLWHFKRFSLFAPLSNIIVAPLIPISMFLSAVSLGISVFSIQGARLIGYFAWFFLEFIVKVAEVMGGG